MDESPITKPTTRVRTSRRLMASSSERASRRLITMIDEKDLPADLKDALKDDEESDFKDGDDESDDSFEAEIKKKSNSSSKKSKPVKKGKPAPKAKKAGKAASKDKAVKAEKDEKPQNKKAKKAPAKTEGKPVVKPDKKVSKQTKIEDEDVEEEAEVSDVEDDGEEAVSSAEGDKGMILNYLKSTNRPYSLINIFDNHHGKIKKKTLEEILDNLEQEKAIIGKLYGKAKIYFYNQIHHPELDQTKVDEAKATLEEFRVMNRDLVNAIRDLKVESGRLDRMADVDELKTQVKDLKAQIEKTAKELESYKAGGVKLVSDEDIKLVETDRDKVSMELKKRTKMLRDIIDTVCEGSEQKPEKIRKMMGLD